MKQTILDLIKEIKEGEKETASLPPVHPKINNVFDGMEYVHDASDLGAGIGLTRKDSFILADKFAKVETQAANEGKNLVRTIEIVGPQLTPKELAFCISHVLKAKQEMVRRITG